MEPQITAALGILIMVATAVLCIFGVWLIMLIGGGAYGMYQRVKADKIAQDMNDGDFSGAPGAVRPELEEEFNDWLGHDEEVRTLTYKGIDISAFSETETRSVLHRLLLEEQLHRGGMRLQ